MVSYVQPIVTLKIKIKRRISPCLDVVFNGKNGFLGIRTLVFAHIVIVLLYPLIFIKISYKNHHMTHALFLLSDSLLPKMPKIIIPASFVIYMYHKINVEKLQMSQILKEQLDNRNLTYVSLLVKTGGVDVNMRVTDHSGLTPLLVAAKERDLEMVKLLLDLGADPNKLSPDRVSALLLATQSSSFEMVKMLVEHGSKIHEPSHVLLCAIRSMRILEYLVDMVDTLDEIHINITPLDAAVLEGRKWAVKLLVDKGANLETRNGDDGTPLGTAVALQNHRMMKYLVKKGADIMARQIHGRTPLHLACLDGNIKTVRIVLNLGGGKDIDACDDYGHTAADLAFKNGHIEVGKILADKGATVNSLRPKSRVSWLCQAQILKTKSFNYPSRHMCDRHDTTLPLCRENPDFLQYLAKLGANVNEEVRHYCPPVYLAAWMGSLINFKTLVKLGADINLSHKCYPSPLHIAAAHGHADIVEYGISFFDLYHGSRDVSSLTVFAARHGHHKVLEVLEKTKVLDMKAVGQFGRNGLILAARNGHEDCVSFFLSRGLSAKLRDLETRTALHYSAELGNTNATAMLMSHNTKLAKVQDRRGNTPLHYAALNGHFETIEALLKGSNAKVNAQNSYSRTPLMYAAMQGKIDCVKVLLNHKANPLIKDVNGVIALDHSRNFEIFSLIENAIFC